MKHFPDKDLTFKLGPDLECYDFSLIDTVQDIFNKYYSNAKVNVPKEERERLLALIDNSKPVKSMCSVLDNIQGNCDLRDLSTADLIQTLLPALSPVEKILGYEFKNKYLLLEAFTHSTFMSTYRTGTCYEKLEVLGDAVLDYVANSNLIKFTMFEKYNIQERLNKEFVTKEDF